jgi:hypothetical protein
VHLGGADLCVTAWATAPPGLCFVGPSGRLAARRRRAWFGRISIARVEGAETTAQPWRSDRLRYAGRDARSSSRATARDPTIETLALGETQHPRSAAFGSRSVMGTCIVVSRPRSAAHAFRPRVALAVWIVTIVCVVCVAPAGSWAIMVARARTTCERASSARALADRCSLTVATCPPATLKEPTARIRILAFCFLDR